MALVERLMGLNADGSEPTGEPDRPKIAVHVFFSAGHEIMEGELTAANVKTALAMDASEQTEMDALVALFPTGSSTANQIAKVRFIERVHAVFILAEVRATGYATAAAVRTKLGL